MTPPRRSDRPVRGVTDIQRRSLDALTRLTLQHHRTPLLREFAAELGLSKQAASRRLHWMAKKGLWRSAECGHAADGRWRGGGGGITSSGLRALGFQV